MTKERSIEATPPDPRQNTSRMDENATVNEPVTKVSPWPVFIAVGLGLAEVGIVTGILPLAVGGILLFGGSVSGILAETDWVESPWTALAATGSSFGAVGLGLLLTRLPALEPDVLFRTLATDPVALRSTAILAAGGVLLLAGVVAVAVSPYRGDMFG